MFIYIYITFSLFLSLDSLECWQQYPRIFKSVNFRTRVFQSK